MTPKFERHLVLICILDIGCEYSSQPMSDCSIGHTAKPIVQGGDASSYLGMPIDTLDALVGIQLDFASSPRHDFCSGVVIANGWVLTAGHCFHDQSPIAVSVAFGNHIRDAGISVKKNVDRVVFHPKQDVALIHLNVNTSATIPIAEYIPGTLTVGSLAELAGYGVTEEMTFGALRIAVEEIAATTQTTISTSGSQISGACRGDSGGPLLVRNDEGNVVVLGILRRGSPMCVGEDEYELVPPLSGWILDSIGMAPAVPLQNCGFLTGEGRCFDRVATWCDGNYVRAEICSNGKTCAWSDAAQGYRCAVLDPCNGVQEFGNCSHGIAKKCQKGYVTESNCGDCDLLCARSSKTGMVGCLMDSIGANSDQLPRAARGIP